MTHANTPVPGPRTPSRAIEGTVIVHAGTARGSFPKNSAHPDVGAVLNVLASLEFAELTDHHDVTGHGDTDTTVRGVLVEPRENGRVAVYWLHDGRFLTPERMPHREELRTIANELAAAGWTIERPVSGCVFAHRPRPQTTMPRTSRAGDILVTYSSPLGSQTASLADVGHGTDVTLVNVTADRVDHQADGSAMMLLSSGDDFTIARVPRPVMTTSGDLFSRGLVLTVRGTVDAKSNLGLMPLIEITEAHPEKPYEIDGMDSDKKVANTVMEAAGKGGNLIVTLLGGSRVCLVPHVICECQQIWKTDEVPEGHSETYCTAS